MRAIIPVAGVGSRLRPHTYSIPKVLLNVAGKPIIGHILDKIIEVGFDEATIVVGYLGEMVKEYALKNYKITYKCFVLDLNQHPHRGTNFKSDASTNSANKALEIRVNNGT